MSYVEKHLIEGETIVYATGLHWTVLLKPDALALICGAPGVFLLVRAAADRGDGSEASTAMMAGGIALLVVAAICIVAGIIRRNATEMVVTDKRVILKVGYVKRNSFELLLQKVESIDVQESVMGRVLGYGTVVVDGTGGSSEPFDRVAHPIEFRKQVQQQIEKVLIRSR